MERKFLLTVSMKVWWERSWHTPVWICHPDMRMERLKLPMMNLIQAAH